MKKVFISLLIALFLFTGACLAESQQPAVALYADGGNLWYYTDKGISLVELNYAVCDNADQTFGELLNFDNLFSVEADFSTSEDYMVYSGSKMDIVEEYVFDDNVLCWEIQSGFCIALYDYEYSYENISAEELSLLTCDGKSHFIVPNWSYEDSVETIHVPAVTLYTDGGEMLIHAEDEDYTASLSVATFELGQTFGELLETDRILSVTKDGAEFAGWTVYEVGLIETISEYVEEEDVLCYEIFDGYFMVLRDYAIAADLISTEEMAAFVCESEMDYVVIANWQ